MNLCQDFSAFSDVLLQLFAIRSPPKKIPKKISAWIPVGILRGFILYNWWNLSKKNSYINFKRNSFTNSSENLWRNHIMNFWRIPSKNCEEFPKRIFRAIFWKISVEITEWTFARIAVVISRRFPRENPVETLEWINGEIPRETFRKIHGEVFRRILL